jgi:5-methyltetrahydropteroyltriglutamate--homocysteine methyltransferase
MKTSTDRILTTHTGSLPRPEDLVDRHDPEAVRTAVAETVRHQRDVGIDIVNDGEASKESYATYVLERLSGFEGDPVPFPRRGRAFDDFPEFFEKQWADRKFLAITGTPTCSGPVSYVDRAKVEADIANLKVCAGDTEVFMTAASPGIIAGYMPNRYYPTTEEYIFALADAMKEEYDTIYRAGFILQLDCPDLPGAAAMEPGATVEEFRTLVAMRLEAVDHATRDIPPDRIRLHMCWGNGEAPHHTDVPLIDLVDLVLASRPAAFSFVAANPRHGHEWKVFEDVKVPDGKVLIPGVLDSTTNFIEHPELVAQRLVRYADVVGKTNIMAGSDCGFATFAAVHIVDPKIAWAKLAAMVEGAQIASDYLWGRSGTRP